MSFPTLFPRWPAAGGLLAAFLLLGGGVLRGEISAPAEVAPLAVALKAEVKRGESVEITLKMVGRQDESVHFKIRTKPRYGKLSEPKMTAPGVASVTYTHGGDVNHLQDAFSYAVQSASGVSAPAAVAINVTDDPPVFVNPERLEFGEVPLGGSSKKEIDLENQGSGIVDGNIETDRPWETAGETHYHLGPGGKQTLSLVFTGSAQGEFNGEVRYTGFPGRTTLLHASVQAPFSASPELVGLRQEQGSVVRSGVFQVTNRTGAAETVKIDLPTRLQGPKEIDLAANETKSVTVKTSPEDVQPVEESIRLALPLLTVSLAVRAPAVGPIIRAAPEALSFGETPAGNEATAKLTIENAGGTRTDVRLSVLPPFEIGEDDVAFPLEPGAHREASVTLRAEQPGSFKESVVITSGGDEVRIPVSARVTPGAQGGMFENVAPQAAPAARQGPIVGSAAAGWGEAFDDTRVYSRVRRIPSIKISHIGSTTCQADWIAPPPGNLTYRLETRELSISPDRKLQVDWVPLADVEYSKSGNKVVARVKGLLPASGEALRVSSIDADGALSRPSPPVFFITAPKWRLKITFLRVLVVALVVLVAGVVRQRYFT